MSRSLIDLTYLVAAVLFIVGLKGLTKPRTAIRGNLIGAAGMLLAIVATLFDQHVLTFGWIVTGLVVGSAVGLYIGQTIQMEKMPEMVAMLNGLGGAASFLVAGAEFAISDQLSPTQALAGGLSGLIGAVTLSGSLVAYAKLAEWKSVRNWPMLPMPHITNIFFAVICLFFACLFPWKPGNDGLYWFVVLISLGLGYSLTMPIGGADMPVVIALLNSYSGLAAAATGFVLGNNVLIIAGALVGASGVLLTKVMCDAMNRSLPAVLFGSLGPTEEGKSAEEVYRTVKSTSAEEIAMLLDSARRVVIVPGYGMAVAQAQHVVRDLTNLLKARDVEVVFGIHPVAGRMPGHMNVLLAEADIPYDLLKELEEINADMEQTDICLVVGANDTVNPDARTNPSSPIAGMPIINADKARTCIVVKRSLSAGFAGIPNPLFACENSLMFFADGKKGLMEVMAALKE